MSENLVILKENFKKVINSKANEREREWLSRTLLNALENSEVEMIKAFFEAGGGIETKINGLTMLEVYLSSKNNKENGMLSYLMEMGADINGETSNGESYFLPALSWLGSGLIEKMIECGGDPNKLDNKGLSGMHYAASRKIMGALYAMLENGGDPNVKNGDGESPLIHMVKTYAKGDGTLFPMAEILLLLKFGADPWERSSKGENLLDVLDLTKVKNEAKQERADLLERLIDGMSLRMKRKQTF